MLLAFVGDYVDGWSPLLKLGHPIIYRGQGDNDQEGTLVVFVLDQVCKQRNGLDCFT
jgi:hypothetical protein